MGAAKKGRLGMRVKNINGTPTHTCACGSWLVHWKTFSRLSLEFCPVEGCTDLCAAGAHVQKDDPVDGSWYIVPMCRTHNAQVGASLQIAYWVKLVSADVAKTCG